jgi:uncharacterized protein (DUF433 family)
MSDSIIIPINTIERKPNSRQYRIVGKGVTVTFLATLLNKPQWTVARICEDYNLTPAEVYAAWAFYYEHQDEIDLVIAEAAQGEPDLAKHAELEARHLAQTGKPYPDDEVDGS